MRWSRNIILLLTMAALPISSLNARVTLTFLSRDFGVYFPHAFIEVSGATDAAPQKPVLANYGFTARALTPGILLGRVQGEIESMDDGYVRGSRRHFSIELDDAEYYRLMTLIDQWRSIPGKSYDLHHRNCVSFVKAVAESVGLSANHADALLLKPRSFLDDVAAENAGHINAGSLPMGSPLTMAAR